MIPHITVPDWITIIGALVTAELAISQGTIKLTNAIPDKWVPAVQAWCGILAALGAGIITTLSRLVGVLLIASLLSLFLNSGSVQAAERARPRLPAVTGNIAADIKTDLGIAPAPAASGSASSQTSNTLMSAIAKPLQDLANFIASDEEGAATLATQVPDLQDTNGRACWLKMQDAGAVFKAHPVPLTIQAMTDFEALRLLQMTANNLCSYSPCTVVFSDAANLATAVSSAVGGALTSSSIPSLTQLCSRIPQISPMLPQAVTGIAPVSGDSATTAPAAK